MSLNINKDKHSIIIHSSRHSNKQNNLSDFVFALGSFRNVVGFFITNNKGLSTLLRQELQLDVFCILLSELVASLGTLINIQEELI